MEFVRCGEVSTVKEDFIAILNLVIKEHYSCNNPAVEIEQCEAY